MNDYTKSNSIDSNMPLAVTLEARQWNSILACANEGLGALAAIMADIQQQCMTQARRSGGMVGANGEEHHNAMTTAEP